EPRGRMNSIKHIFVGADGKLRPIWRAALFVIGSIVIQTPFLDWLFARAALRLHVPQTFSPGALALAEFENFLTALIITGAFALYERRRVDSYGLPVKCALSPQTLEGTIAGVLMAGAVAVGMILLGGMHIRGLALAGGVLVGYAIAWLGTNICVGIAEEFWF